MQNFHPDHLSYVRELDKEDYELSTVKKNFFKFQEM